MSVRSVLDHEQAPVCGHVRQAVDVRNDTSEMHGDQRARPVGNSFGDAVGIDVVGSRLDVDEHWSGADPANGQRGCNKAVRGHDHLVPGADAECMKGQFERHRPAGHGEPVRGIVVLGEEFLECLDDFPTAAPMGTLQDFANPLQVTRAEGRPRRIRHATHRLPPVQGQILSRHALPV